MCDDDERVQRVLEGRCPECGHDLPGHNIMCNSPDYSRFMRLGVDIVKMALIDRLKRIKDKKDV